jgi:hypothetical protein
MFIEFKPGEKVIMVLRRYWLIILIRLLKIALLSILPFLVWPLISFFLEPANSLIASLFWLLAAFWWLLVWTLLFVAWINYYFDIWVVTDQRIIDVRQKKLFKREVAELSFLKIQDLTIKISGAIRTFFNFGTVEIRTAGTFESDKESNVFALKDIHRPSQVQNTISGLLQDFLKQNGQRA